MKFIITFIDFFRCIYWVCVWFLRATSSLPVFIESLRAAYLTSSQVNTWNILALTEKLITVLYTSHSVRCCFISLSISCGIEWISSKMNKNYPVMEPDGIHKLDWMTECYCVVNIVFLRKLFQQTWHRCILSCDWCGEEDECLNSKRAFSNYRATLYNNHY